ncbi:tRNA-specific 2-thiouridylase [uncultured Rikenella sp.]|uniref:tRNA-specific 2-thiouridylase n=2 Tax=uncultured Rikenella sp. TaxID=368003 RepID=UPI0025F475F6|nr:tRNA-specific 2-thiouridylase [uncultured Rikenella sp.]
MSTHRMPEQRDSVTPGTEILVAWSGGIDSATAAHLLREAGYRPRALFLDLLDSAPTRERAAAMAEKLAIPLTIEPCHELFRRKIIGYTLAEHAAGRTPAPCSRCNPRIKWRLLAEAADRMGIHHIATGHYARTATLNGHACFRRGADAAKDQSYYLWEVPEEIIVRAILPLGDSTKQAVKAGMAERYADLPTGRESMGVCFTEGLKYEDFLRHSLPAACLTPGEAVDGRTGAAVGRHEGYGLYTAGQKRGITLFDPAPYGGGRPPRVVSVDPARNRVIVSAEKEALLRRTLWLTAWRTVVPPATLSEYADELDVRVRGIGRNPRKGCRIAVEPDGELRLDLLHDAAWAPMPGQPVVFYLGDCVAGGGILERI